MNLVGIKTKRSKHLVYYADVIANSDGVEVEKSSTVCSCATGYYDARKSVNNRMTELDPKNKDTRRCRECPKVGNDLAVSCTTPGQKLSDLVALRGFYRANPDTVKFFKCKDVEFPGTDPSTSTHCVGGIVDGDAGKPTNGDDRKLLSSNESITISDDNTSKAVASQCAIGRMGPLCNNVGYSVEQKCNILKLKDNLLCIMRGIGSRL